MYITSQQRIHHSESHAARVQWVCWRAENSAIEKWLIIITHCETSVPTLIIVHCASIETSVPTLIIIHCTSIETSVPMLIHCTSIETSVNRLRHGCIQPCTCLTGWRHSCQLLPTKRAGGLHTQPGGCGRLQKEWHWYVLENEMEGWGSLFLCPVILSYIIVYMGVFF